MSTIVVLGVHRLIFSILYFFFRKKKMNYVKRYDQLPKVTVQLPFYNEGEVVNRSIDSVCAMDYPKELIQIQALDDSNDSTSAYVAKKVQEKKLEGFDIVHIQRDSRIWFKPGACNDGLKTAKGDILVIFDADFVPHKDFLQKTVHYFTNEKIAGVQTRWGYLNPEENFLTQLQAATLDTQYEIEHRIRSLFDMYMMSNGTSLLFRTEYIKKVGGWPERVDSEDFDMGFLFHLNGWKVIYHPEILSDGELPNMMTDFISQVVKWSYLSANSAKFLLPKVLKTKMPFYVKLDALFQIYVRWSPAFGIAMMLLWIPLVSILTKPEMYPVWLITIIFSAFTAFSMMLFHTLSQNGLNKKWYQKIWMSFFFLFITGLGLCVTILPDSLKVIFSQKYVIPVTRKGNERKNLGVLKKKMPWKIQRTMGSLAIFCIYLTVLTRFGIMRGWHISWPLMLLGALGCLYIILGVLRDYKV
jgi:cellulose synthase/poly-beta-1,6-N-acetylglucosamine synthase-like glycosyltransferase